MPADAELQYHVRFNSKIRVNFRCSEVLKDTDVCVLYIYEISSLFMLLRSRKFLATFLLNWTLWETSRLLVNFQFKRFSEILMIVSHEFSQFLQYSCFQGQWIYCWKSYQVNIFWWTRNSRSTSGSRCSHWYWWFVLWIFTISSVLTFFRSGNPLQTSLLIYQAKVTLKIKANFRNWIYSKLLKLVS